MLSTREQFFAAIERYERQLSPEQDAAEQKALSEKATDFKPGLADPLAQVRNAIEALLEPMRSAREVGKRISDAHRDITTLVVSFKRPLLFEPHRA
jgi:hypothetical protein